MTIIQINLDDTLFHQANAILSAQGLSIPEAIKQWLSSIATGEQFYFNFEQPNADTYAAMYECEEDLPSFTSVDTLMEHLRENC